MKTLLAAPALVVALLASSGPVPAAADDQPPPCTPRFYAEPGTGWNGTCTLYIAPHLREREREQQLAARRARDRVVETLRAVVPLARGPLGSTCDAPELRAAVAAVYDEVNRATSRVTGETAALSMNSVAAIAVLLGCPEVARGLYLSVIHIFVGSGYAAYRQRAEIGLAELRAPAAGG